MKNRFERKPEKPSFPLGAGENLDLTRVKPEDLDEAGEPSSIRELGVAMDNAVQEETQGKNPDFDKINGLEERVKKDLN